MRLHRLVRLLSALLLFLSLTGCAGVEPMRVVVRNDPLSPFAEIAEAAVGEVEASKVEEMLEQYDEADVLAVELPDTLARQLIAGGSEGCWYPLYRVNVVIAVDREQCSADIAGWRDLIDCGETVCFAGDWIRNRDYFAAMSRGLDGENLSLDNALTLLKELYTENRLLFCDDVPDDPFSDAAIAVLFDADAAYLQSAGHAIEIISPAEGSLSFELGLFSKKPLEIDTDAVADARAAFGLPPAGMDVGALVPDVDSYEGVLSSMVPRLRREVYQTHLFSTADAVEHFASWLVLIIVITFWGAMLDARIVHKGVRRIMRHTAFWLLVFILMRLAKSLIDQDIEPPPLTFFLGRECQNMYMIPLLAVSTLFLWLAWALRQPPDTERPPRWYPIPVAVTAAFALLFATNDLHQLVYLFIDVASYKSQYSYGVGLYLLHITNFLFLGIFVITVIRGFGRTLPFRRMLLPLVTSLLIPAYAIVYALGLPPFGPLTNANDVPIRSLLVLLFAESLLTSRVVPSNAGYARLFSRAGMWMQILDTRGSVVYETRTARLLPAAGDGRLMRETPITAGKAVTSEDISALEAIRAELLRKQQELTERNELLAREEAVRAEMHTLQYQNALYDAHEAVIGGRLHRVEELLRRFSLEGEVPAPDKLLVTVLLMNVKQMSALFFSGQSRSTLSLLEISNRIRRTCRVLGDADIDASAAVPTTGGIPLGLGMLLYECFSIATENTVARALASVAFSVWIKPGVSVRFSAMFEDATPYDEGVDGLLMDSESLEQDPAQSFRYSFLNPTTAQRIRENNGRWTLRREDAGSVCWIVTAPWEGGDAVC